MPLMLATLTEDYFDSKEWVYEHKFDGERCLVIKKNGKVSLMSRNKNSMNAGYPELVRALEEQQADNFIIDGEIVAVGKTGLSDFQLLQGRINLQQHALIEERQKNIRIKYCIFDVLYVAGYDVRPLPWYARNKILKKVVRYNKLLAFTKAEIGNGLKLFKRSCSLGWEGLIVKRKESTYVGKRSREWLKFKCAQGQELVIGGYTQPRGGREHFGALLVGYYQKGKLLYAGKVGTGYSEATLALLGKKLRALAIEQCPFSNYTLRARNVVWVKPLLVADFKFAQWTRGGKLRVGRYKGLRDDKKAKDVVREQA